MMNNKFVLVGIGVVLGIVFAQQVKKVPLVNKIPTV
jgi:hypothetical protein